MTSFLHAGGSRVEVLTQDGCRVGARVVFLCHAGSPLDVAVLKTDAPLSHGMTLMDCWSLSSWENGCCGGRVTVAGYSLHRPTLSHCLPLLTSGCVSKVHNFENIPVMYQVGVVIARLIVKMLVSSYGLQCFVTGNSSSPFRMQWWGRGCHGYTSTHWHGNQCHNVSDVM